MTETDIQNNIRLQCADIAMLWRINVGAGRTESGSYIKTGVPKGFTDLFGHRISDGKAIYIEVKRPGKTRTEAQVRFGGAVSPAIYGVAHSAEEARNIILEG